MPISAEDFARWRDDRVTRWVFAAIRQGVEDQRKEWERYSWENGGSNPVVLQELRVRADAYRALVDTDYRAWCEILGEEPRDE